VIEKLCLYAAQKPASLQQPLKQNFQGDCANSILRKARSMVSVVSMLAVKKLLSQSMLYGDTIPIAPYQVTRDK
jgi:hypothetical protein